MRTELEAAPEPRPAPIARPWRRNLKRLAWGLLLGCLAGELGLRLLDFARGQETGSLYDEIVLVGGPFDGAPPPRVRFRLRPGRRLVVPERYGDIRYEINQAGYRDDDHDREQQRPRLLVLGDSVSFGLGVDQDKIYPEVVERALRQETGEEWEVVNLAIFAYHTGMELDALREDGLSYRPRLILLQFYMNDFATPEAGAVQQPQSLATRLRGLRNQLLYSSNLYRRVHQLVFGFAYRAFHDSRRLRHPEKLNHGEPAARLNYLAERPEDGAIPAFGALAEIAGLARQQGAGFAVLLTPDEVQLFTPRYDAINQRIARFCAAQGIPLVDALPALRAAPEKHRLFLDGVHLSAAGHRLVAAAVAAELSRRGLPP